MIHDHGISRGFGALLRTRMPVSNAFRRNVHYDGRNRLSKFWTPTQGKKQTTGNTEDSHELLLRAGFLRQAHAGIFHLLPLGLRVQHKIERLIDKHMLRLGASKVSLSSITSEELWQRSGRLEGRGSEFFRLQDRKDAKYLLSPTHEEEITTIVANAVHSYRDLPLRLYQVSRKYRDEARPRQGLLRGREFIMKDLYTFDVTEQQARITYEEVRTAYSAFLDELRLPYLVASASSGNMGGNLSHEFHFASPNGEDVVISCPECGTSINEEIYIANHDPEQSVHENTEIRQTVHFVSKDRQTLISVYVPEGAEANIAAIKALCPETDPGVNDPKSVWLARLPKGAEARDIKHVIIRDPRCSASMEDDPGMATNVIHLRPELEGRSVRLTKAQNGDACPHCSNGKLELQSAVEIGHTFHLGTRYSEPLGLKVLGSDNEQVAVSMGCHGIGVSRLIGAVASLLADGKGLNWPAAIAPFSALLVAAGRTTASDVEEMYDNLSGAGIDVAVDDRDRPTGWKLNDADLVGYPFIVVLGKGWAERREVELQCRRLGVKEEIKAEHLAGRIAEYSARL